MASCGPNICASMRLVSKTLPYLGGLTFTACKMDCDTTPTPGKGDSRGPPGGSRITSSLLDTEAMESGTGIIG